MYCSVVSNVLVREEKQEFQRKENPMAKPIIRIDPTDDRKIIVKCNHCDKERTVLDTPHNRDIVFCSASCAQKWMVENKRHIV